MVKDGTVDSIGEDARESVTLYRKRSVLARRNQGWIRYHLSCEQFDFFSFRDSRTALTKSQHLEVAEDEGLQATPPFNHEQVRVAR
jgi:hypothetical protein